MTATSSYNNTVIVIAGPTAVGKTSLAIQLAQAFNTHIISADSRQCYQELDIAVAKPSPEQLATVKHYFIASHSIHQKVDAGIFEQYALHAAEEIFTHNKVAVMVGGTGLYINAFCNGIDNMPTVDNAIRNQVIEQYNEGGLQWLQKQVQEKDPAFWQVAEQQNPQRLMRALEFVLSTGESITNYRKGIAVQRPFRIIKVALQLPKELLQNNINTRVDEMVDAGLLKEAEQLFPFRHLNALQTVGYTEIFDYFDGKLSLTEAFNLIKIHTRQYAKRQMTMFRKNDDYHWINMTDNTKEQAVEEILGLVQNR